MADFGITTAYGYGQYSAGYEQGYFGAAVNAPSAPEDAAPAGKAGKADKTGKTDATGKNDPLDPGGCKTCRERTYVDGSNESDVSFKTPGHIDPGAAPFVVAGHEREHVANAVQKASAPGAKLISASVRLITSICPECGRSYVAGGVTNTIIQYNTDVYAQGKKKTDGLLLNGGRLDMKL